MRQVQKSIVCFLTGNIHQCCSFPNRFSFLTLKLRHLKGLVTACTLRRCTMAFSARCGSQLISLHRWLQDYKLSSWLWKLDPFQNWEPDKHWTSCDSKVCWRHQLRVLATWANKNQVLWDAPQLLGKHSAYETRTLWTCVVSSTAHR